MIDYFININIMPIHSDNTHKPKRKIRGAPKPRKKKQKTGAPGGKVNGVPVDIAFPQITLAQMKKILKGRGFKISKIKK